MSRKRDWDFLSIFSSSYWGFQVAMLTSNESINESSRYGDAPVVLLPFANPATI